MINFVIPSIGRETLKYTLESILNQTDPDWECWVGFDGLSESEVDSKILIKDERIHYIYLKDKIGKSSHHGNAGLVRNSIMENIDNDKGWIGFVDDDDTIQREYVQNVRRITDEVDIDVCVFRMRYDRYGMKIIPPPGMKEIKQNYVGISFFVRKNFIEENKIYFVNDNAEDFKYLESIIKSKGKVAMTELVMYNVEGYKYINDDDSHLMDKNKSSYKLKDFGPIYCINLDGQPERWDYMERQFKHWEIENYTRISAYDGRDDDLSDILTGRYPEMVTSGEIGCVTSHLKAIKHWYETSDTPYAIIMEDDCNIDVAKFWNFTWKEFISRVPYSWDVIQLAIICTGDIHVPIHTRFVNDFSTACYAITRHHAEKLLKYHIKNGKYKLDNGVKPRPVADDLVYNSGCTYACPLFLYKIELGSSIHPEHIDIFHRQSHNGLLNFWTQRGSEMTIDVISNFDPYLGRIVEPSTSQDAS
jgi:glycosyltransferase involved in cell wall biosynthesis